MSLRCAGLQLLQTAPSTLLDSASTVSVSFWVEVNAANNVSDPNGVEIFGDTGGKFSATLSGTGSMLLRWSSWNGQANSVSSCAMTLLPGSSYHIAATWQSGWQQYYLNGVRVGTDIKTGSLGVSGDTLPHAYRLGSDQSGTDVTIDQPTIWVGYALTESDVTQLRDRGVTPSNISPSSLALAWSLSGQDGVAAQIGDPGLIDSSINLLNLTTIVGNAPIYQAKDLTYLSRPTVSAVASPSGQTLVLMPSDGSGVKTNFLSYAPANEIQQIQILRTPAGDAFTLSFGGSTSASIPVTVTPPIVYALWTFPTIVGNSYDLAVTYPTATGASSQYGFETINGGSVVSLEVFSNTGAGITPGYLPFSGGFNDPGQYYPDGTTPVPWEYVAQSVVATATTMQVRVTGTADALNVLVDGLRVKNTTTGTITYYDDGGPEFSIVDLGNQRVNTGLPYGLDGTVTILEYPQGIGPITTITPSGGNSAAQTLQAILEAMPTIGVGNILVTDQTPGGQSGIYQYTLVGALGNSAQSLFTVTDPGLVITEINHGGNVPILTLNGSTMPVADWLFPSGIGVLPQAAPASETCPVYNQTRYSHSDYWDGEQRYFDPNSVSGAPLYGWSSRTASFTFPQLPPGTYQFAATYPTATFTSVDHLSFSPSTATQFLLFLDGVQVATATVDQTQPLTDYSTTEDSPNQLVPGIITVGWKILFSATTTASRSTLVCQITTVGQSAAASGQPQYVATLDAIQIRRTSSDTSIVIHPGDTATLSIPANWATTAAGPLPALANLPIASPSTTAILPAFVDGPKTMEVGTNLTQLSYGTTTYSHSNLFYGNNVFWKIRNSDDYPSRLVAHVFNGVPDTFASENVLIIGPPSYAGNGDPWQGTRVVANGLFVLTWDGDPTITLTPHDAFTIITDVTSSYPTPSGCRANWRVYNLQAPPHVAACPTFYLTANSNTPDPADTTGTLYLINLSNVEIYPPDPADPTGMTVWGLDNTTHVWTRPPLFPPHETDHLQGYRSIRMMDVLNSNANPFTSLAGFKPVTNSNRAVPTRQNYTLPVQSIQASTYNYFRPQPTGESEIAITFAQPHGLWDALGISFNQCGTAQFGNGFTSVMDFATHGSYGLIHVIDATTIVCLYADGNGTPMTNVLTGGEIVASNYGAFWPLEEIVERVNTLPDATSLHFCMPLAADTTPGGGVYQIGAKIGTLLNPGLQVHLEPGNEAWNPGQGVNAWAKAQNRRLGNSGGYNQYYIQVAKAIHDQFVAGMASVGRGGDVVRMIGCQAENQGDLSSSLQLARQIGMQIDEVVVANYYDAYPITGYTTEQLLITNGMTVDQLLDWLELTVAQGSYTQAAITANLAVMQEYGYGNAKISCYEAAFDMALPSDPVGSAPRPPANTPNYFARQQGVLRHPRMYNITLQMLQTAQNAGLARWRQYTSENGTGPDGWDTWEGTFQQPGTGDPTVDTINLTRPLAKNRILSEVGGALQHWASLVQPTTSNTTSKIKMVPGRNGMIRSYGFARGTFRLSHGR